MVIRSAVSANDWEALASATFVPVRVEARAAHFATTMDHRGDREWGLTSISGDACRVSRTPELLASSREDLALFSLQISGSSLVEQNGRQTEVPAGHGVLYLTSSTYDLSFPQTGQLSVLQVPTASLGMSADSLRALTARAFDVRRNAGLRTFSRVVRSLFTDRPVLDDDRQTLRVATEILGAALRQHRRVPARTRSHAALFAAFDRIVHERLEDPRLDVVALAAGEGVSIRTVHQVFSERGMAPATYIRRMRMRRAESLLESTSLRLADIAVRCGIDDPSVFSRTFRAHAGLTPSEYRRSLR